MVFVSPVDFKDGVSALSRVLKPWTSLGLTQIDFPVPSYIAQAWVVHVLHPETLTRVVEDRRCISERAIDRTFHRVRMTYGAWNHLALYEKLGCTPTMHDLVALTSVIPEMTHKTLQQNRLTDVWGNLTDRGRAALAVPENEREQYWDTLRG